MVAKYQYHHQAYRCFCGSTRFNLIYDGSIECDACGYIHPWRHDVEVAVPIVEKLMPPPKPLGKNKY